MSVSEILDQPARSRPAEHLSGKMSLTRRSLECHGTSPILGGMKSSTVFHYSWRGPSAAARFRSGISLHSHTLHSRERLDFLFGILRAWAPLRWAVHREQLRRQGYSTLPDFSRVWYTPPLGPRQSWEVEAGQIEDHLGLNPLVSLTDHDAIDAPLALRPLDRTRHVPISLEWTAPFRDTFFHIGVHNLPAAGLQERFRRMLEYTAAPAPETLTEILDALHASSETLVVLNHPFWDEKGLGPAMHRVRLFELLAAQRSRIHAIEVNGLRPWKENLAAAELAASWGIPAVAGGDRHGHEPNAVVNLTRAGTWPEFIDDVRRRKISDVLYLPAMKESRRVRILGAICDVVRDNPDHGLGWRRWSDRFFYLCDDGAVRSLSDLWTSGREPALIRNFVGLMNGLRASLANGSIRSALRLALADFGDTAPEVRG